MDSNPDRGSTFWFTVPMKPIDSGDLERSRNLDDEPDTRTKALQSSLRVLVADDNATNRKLLVDILSLAGHTVDIAANGVEAVEAARRVRYDLIFMDVRMPEMDGVAAAQEIRSLPKGGDSVPIVAVTGNAMRGDRERFLEAGLTDYLAKPFNMHDVLSAVNKAVGSARSPILAT